ncbi:MAG TPA: chromate transporter [Herbaspirillum sp.]|jgi:chromate transporter
MTDMTDNIYLKLVLIFAPLSLVSFGGGQSVVADINRHVIEQHWLTQAQFVNLFAISRAAPGPGALLTTLIGWDVAGITGAFIATFALFAPSSTAALLAFHFWSRVGKSRIRHSLERSLTPIAAGMIFAGGLSVLRSSPHTFSILAIAVVSTIAMIMRPRSSPLLVLALAGLFQYLYTIAGFRL